MVWETFPHSYTSPQNHFMNCSKPYELLFFWVRVTNKMLNVNWERIHSIILSFTCHGLIDFAPTHTHPFKTICEFLETLWVIIFWVRVTNKMLNVTWVKIHSIILSVTCHGLRNCSPTHTHPLKTIHEFSKPYELLFFELESLIKCWMWLAIKIHSIILSVTCHGLRNFPLLIHIPSKPFVNFQNPMSYYFLS